MSLKSVWLCLMLALGVSSAMPKDALACTCFGQRGYDAGDYVTFFAGTAGTLFTQAQLDQLTSSIAAWRIATNNAYGATIVDYRRITNESTAQWRFYPNQNYSGTGIRMVTDHGSGTIWVNPDLLDDSASSLRNSFLHEVGHALGYEDTGCTDSVMYGTYQSSVTSLTCGDNEHLEDLYGGGGSGPFCDDTCSPIIIDLGSLGVRLTGPDVWFDIDASGDKELVGWTQPNSDDGFLDFQRDGNGRIDDGRELFGERTPLSWDMNGPLAKHGFEALAWFDRPENYGNGDGWIDSSDYVYSLLQVWVDSNHNGISEPMELGYLEQHGVVRISLDAQSRRHKDEWGNTFGYRATVLVSTDGRHIKPRTIWDVFLVVDRP